MRHVCFGWDYFGLGDCFYLHSLGDPRYVVVLGLEQFFAGHHRSVFFDADGVFGHVNSANKKWLGAFKKDVPIPYKDEVGRFVRWAYITQKNGLQGLENDAMSTVGENDPFLKYGVELVISGYTGTEIREILKESAFSTYQRDGKPSEILTNIGAYAPAFGMAGTLIGLVVMLGNMGADPAAIGSGMAVALITTFYGVMSARLIYLPIGVKLGAKNDETLFRNLLVTESLVLLAERKSPRYIQDKLNAFLDPSQHFLIDRDMQR